MSYPEDMRLSFVMRWINHSHETRTHFMAELLELLDPTLVSPKLLRDSQNKHKSNSVFADWTARAQPAPYPNEAVSCILVSRRLGSFGPLKIRLFSQAKHRQIEKLRGKITDGSYVCNGYYIYHQEGWQHSRVMTDSYVYHPIRSRWAAFKPLLEARAYHRSCVVSGGIFSVGGSNGVKALPSVEFVDLYTGQQHFSDPLPRAKERTGLGVHENSMYAVGGSDRGTYFKCIHRYDVREGAWQELASSPFRAGATSCAFLGGSIYTTHPDTLQRYDIRANDWEMISAQYKRYPEEVFALDGALFGLFSDHVARFIFKEGRWENQRILKCCLPFFQVSTNLLLPNVNEDDIRDTVFEGFPKPYDFSQEYDEGESSNDEDDGNNSEDDGRVETESNNSDEEAS